MRRGFTRNFITSTGAMSVLAVLAYGAQVGAQVVVPPPLPPPPPVDHPEKGPYGSERNAPTREEVGTPPPTSLSHANVQIDSSQANAAAPCTLDTSDLQVTINSVQFKGIGNGDLPPGITQVLEGFGPLTQGQQPIRNVCDIRDRANLLLRNSGYIASVQIVPQDMSSGVLQLMVVTAHITEVHVHGDPGAYRGLMDDRIAELEALNPLNEFDAEKILLLTSDVPGLDVKLSLRSAGTTPGAVIGDLSIETVPYKILTNVQNLGSRQVGPETGYIRAEFYGLTHHEDVTYIGLSDTLDTEEQQIVQIGHNMGLGHDGSTIGGSFIYASSQPDLGALDLRTVSTIFNVEYFHPFIRSLRRDLGVAAGLDIVEQKTKIYGDTGSTPLNLDKLTVAYVRAQGLMRRPDTGNGRGFLLKGAVEVRQGLDAFDATKKGIQANGFTPSRFDGNPEATVVRVDADANWGLGPVFTLVGALRSQWASDALLSYEEFSVGNLNIGRGYDPGANAADSAIGLRAELRARLPHNTAFQTEAFGFYDNVHIWNKDIGTTENDRTLASWGAGLRFYLPKMVAEIYYAKPLDKALTIDDKPPEGRIMFSLTTQFVPSSN